MSNTLACNDPILLVNGKSYAIIAYTNLVFAPMSSQTFNVSYLKGIG